MGVAASSAAGRRAQQAAPQYEIGSLLLNAHARPFPVALDEPQCADVLARLGLAPELVSDLWALCAGPSAARKVTLQEVLTAMIVIDSGSALSEKLVRLCLLFSPQAVETQSAAQLELHYDDCFLCAFVVLRTVLAIAGDPAAEDGAELARVAECVADDVFVVARKTVDEYLVTDDLLRWATARGVEERRHTTVRDLRDLNAVLPLEARFCNVR